MFGRCIGELSRGEYVFTFQDEIPKLGFIYELEDVSGHSKGQRAAFHALLNRFYEWMAKIDTFQFEDNGRIFDFRVPSASAFRDKFKYDYGKSWFEYADDDFQIIKVKNLDEIPTHILTWRDKSGEKTRWSLRLKSMKDYTKREYTQILQSLLDIVHATNCQDAAVLKSVRLINEQKK